MRKNKKRILFIIIGLLICITILAFTAIEVNFNQNSKLNSNVKNSENDQLIEKLEADYFEDLYSEVPDEGEDKNKEDLESDNINENENIIETASDFLEDNFEYNTYTNNNSNNYRENENQNTNVNSNENTNNTESNTDLYAVGKEATNFEEKQKINKNIDQTIVLPHIDEETGVKYVTYEDFGAKSDENYDNYESFKLAHDYANKYGYEVRAMQNIYHIYKLTQLKPIEIQTNTNWGNAQIYIHDENIKNLSTREYSIFEINSNSKEITITDKNILQNINLNKEVKNIPQLAGYGKCICIAYNKNKRQFIRIGNFNSTGNIKQDIFVIDNQGNLLNELQWDFEEVTSIKLIQIPDNKITIKNGNFITIFPSENYEQSSGYYQRNILCTRSNVSIENINHTVNDNEIVWGPYFGFIKISYASYIEMTNCILYTHKCEQKSNYDLILEFCTNVQMNNIISNDIYDLDRWGITGTNYTKDITYNNCKLNRIDAHCGVHNLNIYNTEIGVKGVTVVGTGILNIKNSSSLTSTALVNLRQDYGSTWQGTINIEDCVYNPVVASTIVSFSTYFENDEDKHDFGYDLYLPNININNLKITETGSAHSQEDIYILYNPKLKDDKNNEKLLKIYNMPNEIKVNDYIINCDRKLSAFYGQENISTQIDIHNYIYENNIILDIKTGTTYEDLIKKVNLDNRDKTFKVQKLEDNNENNNLVATGDIIVDETGKEYILAVLGDLNCDGLLNLIDLAKMKRYIVGEEKLSEAQKIAGDLNLSKEDINLIDLVQIKRIIVEQN